MPILYPRFGSTAGNAGNQLFQLAAMIGFAKKYNCEFMVPEWKYSYAFVNPPMQYKEEPKVHAYVNEGSFSFTEQWWANYAEEFRIKNVAIFGWLQSWHYFEHCREEVKQAFTFKPEIFAQVKEKNPDRLFDKPVIAISVRRGDYVNNPNYVLLSARYYIMALQEYFPDFREKYNLMFFSDDIPYCKVHFQCLKNAYFAENMDPIEQLCLGSQCDHSIIANSTFSYWIATLQELNGKNPTVVRPVDIFKGKMKQENDISDHYPPHWHLFNPDHVRINLKDVTFTIPVMFDSKDRMDNLELCIQYLQEDFETNIILGEMGTYKRFEHYKDKPGITYHFFNGMDKFHRTQMLNDMARMCSTPVVVNWDADVLVPPMQIIESVRLIKEQRVDMVYPYDGRFARVPRQEWVPLLRQFKDTGMFGATKFRGAGDLKEFNGPYSVGGAVMYNIDSFMEGGMENEHMISYAPEDSERYERFNRLGYSIERVQGTLYHIDHAITENSSLSHIYYGNNLREYQKMQKMNNEELRAYVRSWPWAKVYRPSYYESIHEEAVRSRDEVFKVLNEWRIVKPGMSIIDVGCGVGSWGFGLEMEGIYYSGIDFGVPADKLVIRNDQYVDHDLKNPLNAARTYDLVISLEVGEHLEEQYADQLIDLLCSLGETVLYSAAIPGQGGIQHHNEQWQSWWAKKFAARGFYPYYLDIRDELWDNENVGLWYRQNMVLYCKEYAEGNPPQRKNDYRLDRVHPKMWTNVLKSAGVIKTT